jgi:hypothetical protein
MNQNKNKIKSFKKQVLKIIHKTKNQQRTPEEKIFITQLATLAGQ